MLLFIVLFILCIAAIVWVRVAKSAHENSGLPPGPFPLPIFGNLLTLLKDPHLKVAEYVYSHNYKLLRMYFGNRLVVFINDPKVMQEAYVSKAKNFSSRPMLHSMEVVTHADEDCHDLAFSNGEAWKRYRRIVAAAFTRTKVRSVQSVLDSELVEFNEQVKKLAKSQLPVDMHFYSKRYALNILQRIFFGNGFSYSDDSANEWSLKLLKQLDILFALLGPTDYVSDFVPMLAFLDAKKKKKLRHESDIFLDMISKEVEQHKRTLDEENPRDVLDAILIESKRSAETGFFHEKDILMICMDMYGGGTDTSATSVEWFWYFLAKFPEYQEQIFAEISKTIGTQKFPSYAADSTKTPFLNAVISETHRICSIGPFTLPRLCEEDDVLDGCKIPKNTILFWNSWAYHHNPSIWGDPSNFRPERFMEPNCPPIQIFGAGPRMCLGASLADEEIYPVVALLCQRYTWQFEKPQPKEIDTGVFTLVLKPHPFKLVLSER